jgi:hypothetical protein
LEVPLGTSKGVYRKDFRISEDISPGGKSFIRNPDFKILLINDGNTLIITNFDARNVINDNYPHYGEDDSGLSGILDDNFSYNNSVSNRQLRPYFNGVYTKTPNYNFYEDQEKLLEKIQNTAWTKQGDTKPSIGFFENNDNQRFTYKIIYDGWINSNMINTTWMQFNLSASAIRISNIIINIAVSDNTLIISNLRAVDHYNNNIESGYFDEYFQYREEQSQNEWERLITFEQLLNFNGIYSTKILYNPDDPDYSEWAFWF